MNTLLTFTGYHDPYSLGLVGEEEQPGPVLSLVQARRFGRVVLFATPKMAENTEATRKALLERFPRMKVTIRKLPLDDPTDYGGILKGLRAYLKEGPRLIWRDRFFVSVASGTPQMHACWVLLVTSGELDATILHVRPPRFVTDDRPLVTEVDFDEVLPFRLRGLGYNYDVDVGSAAKAERPAAGYAHLYEMDEVEEEPDYTTAPSRLEVERVRLGIVGDHPAMQEVLERADVAAPTDMSVLILGETGAGKELLARLVHGLSDRAEGPFVPLNCGAMPRELVDSVLFGHVRGAFTGALDHEGKFAEADRGTLFLDEVAELPPETQVRLLRVLEDGEVRPVGSKRALHVDVRIIAATNKDLDEAVAEGRFREDLFYRLNTVTLTLPPLRERASDIPKIALHLLENVNERLKRPKQLSKGALVRLQRHSWPGNVRDLKNVLARSALLCRRDLLEADDLLIGEPASVPDTYAGLPTPHEGFDVNVYLDSVRKQLFLRALELAGGNQSAAARFLGVTPQAVNRFLAEPGNHA